MSANSRDLFFQKYVASPEGERNIQIELEHAQKALVKAKEDLSGLVSDPVGHSDAAERYLLMNIYRMRIANLTESVATLDSALREKDLEARGSDFEY